MSRREEVYPEIKRLREVEGLKWREVGERVGLSLKMAHDYYVDPTGEKTKARKDRNNGICKDCGAATKNSGSINAPDRCSACRRALEKTLEYRMDHGGGGVEVWADDAILSALRRVAVNRRLTVATYDAAYLKSSAPLPSRSTVIKRFGSWAAAHEAAGLQARHHRLRSKFPPERCLRAVRECAEEIGRVPTIADYRAWSSGGRGPSESLIRARCGSWREVIIATANTSEGTDTTSLETKTIDPGDVGASRGRGSKECTLQQSGQYPAVVGRAR